MEHLAVDVVLLPEPRIAHDCIAMNERLVSAFASEIVLDYDGCLPHVSLAMGCMTPEALPEIATRLQRLLDEIPIEPFQCAGINTQDHGQGRLVSSLDLISTPTLQALHERIMIDLEPLLHRDPTETLFHGDEAITSSTLGWVRDYRENSGFAAFSPHITLGYGRLEQAECPPQFWARSLAVCHLGNHCTCRRVLWERAISNQ